MRIKDSLKTKLMNFDYLMFILVIGLSIFGILIISSATRITIGGSTEAFVNQQLFVASGIVLLLLAAFIDYRFIARFYIIAYSVNMALLIAVHFWGHGIGIDGNVQRALRIGNLAFGIQPSEFAKVLMILFLAVLIDRYHDKLNHPLFLSMVLGSIALPVLFIFIQPSLSAAVVVLAVSLIVIFVGGLSFKYILAAFLVIVPAAYLFILDVTREYPRFVTRFMAQYQIEGRILPFLSPEYAPPDAVRQTMNSIRAIGSGQLFGQGLHEGTFNQLNYVPHSHNDFIFAVIGEELGYAGGIAVLAVLLLISLKCLFVSVRAKSVTGKLIAAGVGFMIAFQTFINVGVAIGILPNTGMVLPFVSYGGSAVWANMVAIGLVINVGMEQPQKTSIFARAEE